MAHVLIMPRQGNTVESCIIVDWKVKEGDKVSADTPICEVETDKATFEIPAGGDGTVLKLMGAVGDDVPVLSPIAVIGNQGEDWAAAIGSAGGGAASSGAVSNGVASNGAAGGEAPAVAAQATVPASDAGQASATNSGTASSGTASSGAVNNGAFASPRARNLAGKEGLPLGGIPGTGPGGRIIERDVSAALEQRPPLTAAARAAAGSGALPTEGSGLGGRITAADLGGGLPAAVQAGSAGKATAAGQGLSIPNLGEGQITDTPVKGIRKLIADRMLQSLAESAQFTLNGNASAVRMQEIRARMKASDEALGLSKVTVNDLVLFAVSRVLPQYAFMNALKIGETLRTFERVHLGVAVDTPKGLMVPVIRNANLLSLKQISAEAKRLASACQNGGIKPEELSGSTFTVTNLGSLGVTTFTPVLNAPEVGILGVCGIELKPVESKDDDGEDSISFEPHIGFSLTINHQVVDGAPAARFLKALGEAIANIDLWLAV
ncbi:acetyltransferase component of pyruvate dehydrogenase complex [Spirochaetia bacterium]|nr:acetyltransferase component of pyruvate dehydrogenase complex [Spirochaetia bacterium]